MIIRRPTGGHSLSPHYKINIGKCKEMKLKSKQDNYAELQNHRSGGNMNSNTFFRDFVAAEIAINNSWNVLDIGCRTGKVLSELWDMEYGNINGIDIGSQAETSWLNLPFKNKLIRCDIHDGIPFDTQYDIITCSHTLEHCYDPLKVREIIYQKLNKHGYLHSIVPIEPFDDFAKYQYHLVCFENHQEHIEFYTTIGLTKIYDNYTGGNSVAIFQKNA